MDASIDRKGGAIGMLIHEMNYQDDDHSNFQERTVEYNSWDDYVDHFFRPKGFVIVDNRPDRGYLRGEWWHPTFNNVKLIHEAHVKR